MTKTNPKGKLAPWEDAPAQDFGGVATANALSSFSEFSDSDLDDAPIPPEKEPLIDEIASEYVGFWNLLVSKTNWEKGKVIHSWRARLQEAGFPRRVCSDDAISQRIGNVSPQHVGRLRRVYERFGEEEMLPNLYWSHYQAALDWDDADEWLQKASEEQLSVAQTRLARWEEYGASPQTKPKDEEVVSEERDEDVNPYYDSDAQEVVAGQKTKWTKEDADKDKKKTKSSKNDGPLGEFADETEPWEKEGATSFTTAEVLDAFANLDPLPADFADAFESLKVAILTRKLEKWPDVDQLLVARYLSEIKRLLVSVEN